MKSFLHFSSVLSASSVKRFFILFFTLFALSIPTWGASATVYFDNTIPQWEENKIFIFLGHDGYSRSDYQCSRVLGTKYLYQSTSAVSYWSDAKYIAFAKDQWSKNGENNSLYNRLPWQGDYNFTAHYSIDKSSTVKYIYKPGSAAKWGKSVGNPASQKYAYSWPTNSRIEYSTYTVTIKTPTGGSLSVVDYDDRAVGTGAMVPYLTVLKVSATANDGYELESVTIGSTTYTADNFTQGQEYTVTAATTISATFTASACTVAPTITINGTPTATANSITANVTGTATGANCTLSDVGLDVYTDQACTNKVKSVSAHATSGTALDLTATGLIHNTTYWIKAHATTGGGTTYTEAVEVKTLPLYATYEIRGSFDGNSWPSLDANKCTVLEGSEDACSITKELAANTTYEFKFVLTDSEHPKGEWFGNNGTMNAGNCTGWTFNTSDGNCKITTTIAGEYTFTMCYKEGHGYQVSVAYPTPVCDEVNECIVPGQTLYLQPNANWKEASARFAAYFFNNCTNQNEWVSMTDADKDGIYECAVPEGNWLNLIFCRMNGANSTNNWDNKWNQTADLNASCGYNLYTLPNEDAWDGFNDNYWGTYIEETPGAMILATRGKTQVCSDNKARFASLYVHKTGEGEAGNEGYKAKSYQWKYSSDGSNWSNYTPETASGYGVKGTNNNIRTYQVGYYRCDITLNNGTDSKTLQSNVIELTPASNCEVDMASYYLYPTIYINTSQDFPTCDQEFNSQCGEDMKAKRTVDVRIYQNNVQLYYDRKARMNIRGSSSLNFPKKSYAFVGGKADAKVGGDVKTDKLGFFGLPEHKDWVLYAAYADASMIRNMLAMQAYGTMTGMWSCHTQYVQVYMDGKFEGIYIFMEKPTYGKGRVMVDENNGYLFGFDKTSVNDRFESTDNSIDAKKSTFKSMYSGRDGITSYNTQFDQRFEIEYPEREDIAFDDDENLVNEQAWTDKVNKLKARINEFEEVLSTRDKDQKIDYARIRSIIDYQTWADWFIINEFCKNLDGFRASNWFIIENEGAPIKASPIWDFELSFGNKAPNSNIAESTEGWLHEQDKMHTDDFPIPFWINGIGATNNNTGDKDGTGWIINADVNFGALLKDPCFKQMVKERWAIHTATGGGIQQLIAWVENPDNYTNLQNILAKEETRWPAAQRGVMGYDAQDTWNTQFIAVRDWVTPRKEAMDALIASWNLGYMHALLKDSTPQDWTTLTPAKTDGVDVYTLEEGREKLVLVGYTKATSDPDGAGLENDMQAATIWKFYPSTEDLTATDLDNLTADKWQFLYNSGNYPLPALSQNECGYYKVEGPICSSNLQSTYMRIKVTPTCVQADCNSYWYRLKLTDKQSGTVFYSSIIKGIDGTAEGTVSIPCYGEFDYVAQCKHGTTYWTDVENTNEQLAAASFRGVTTLKVLLDNCKATTDATNLVVKFVAQTEGVTPYYQVGFYHGGELITGCTSLSGETGITLKESASFENLHMPTGTTYAIYKRDNAKSYDALYSCIVEQNYIASEFTNLPVNQSVTATLTVDAEGNTAVTFTTQEKEPNYWVSTLFAGQTGFDHGTKDSQVKSDGKDNNTMFAVNCAGNQAGATGNFYLYKFMEKNPGWSYNELANSGVKDGNNNNVEVATHADPYQFHNGDGMASVWVRWLFDANQGQLHVHYVRDMHLELKDAEGNTQRVAPTTSDAATGMITFKVDDLTNVASYRIVANPPYAEAGKEPFDQFPYGAEYQTVSTNLGSATFTYNYAQNCMTVDYSDITTLEIPCENGGISINKDGRVEVIVTNTGTLDVLEGAYTVVVNNHTTKLTMRGTGENFASKALAVGESETFTSTDVISGDYNLQASLYLGTKLVGTCSLRDLDCDYVVNDTVRYTVDANLGIEYEDPCQLTFGSLENAIKHLKSTPKFIKGGSLVYPVVMEVAYSKTTYTGTRTAGVSGGGEQSQNSMAIIIDNINQMDASRPLIIRAANPKAAPWVQHVIIRNSRNITLDGLFLVSDVTGIRKDNAIEFDINVSDWDIIPTGAVKDANIVVKNSTIGSSGFTGLHASGYDGITFINNNFEAVFDGSDANSVTWGASAKFIRCKNIQFLRNNFRGDHATLVWLQECTDALFMNNVFWNTNKYQGRCAAIRLISQFGFPVDNMAFYYNTLYLADSEINSYKYDFLHFGQQHESVGSYPDSYTNIEFMYNNAYSYDTDIPGRNTDAEAFYGIDVRTKYPNFCQNNFWSEYDQILWETKYSNSSNWHSKFSFGCNQDMINVKDQLCGTTATGPASLIVRGNDLNLGVRPSGDLAEHLGATKGHDHDRYNSERPADGKEWTLGAYQMGEEKETDVIIWQGVASSDWDDRNNWIDKEGRRLNCLNLLSTELTAIIPAEFSHQYTTPAEGIRNWPKIPQKFDEGRTNMDYGEHVSAGLGMAKEESEITQYVKHIVMEYGAAIEGVERLVENAGEKEEVRRYDDVVYGFDVEREQWVLVGTVVKKADPEAEDGSGYRDVVSGDYYIHNHEPHVYMHKAYINGEGQADWGSPFPDLTIPVPSNEVFAIKVADQYGPNKLPAKRYYRKGTEEQQASGSKPWSYTFDGRFVNESAMPSYTGLTVGEPVLLNNSYPMNISAQAVEDKWGSVLLYDYVNKSFGNIVGDAVIKPQHGFVIEPNASTIYFTPDMVVGGDTKSRSVAEQAALYVLKLSKANSTTGEASTLHIAYNEYKDMTAPAMLDTRKVWSYNTSTPDVYAIMHDAAYQRLFVNSSVATIPLGIKLQEAMPVAFSKVQSEGFVQMTLVDMLTGKAYNLLGNDKIVTEELPAGVTEGRFFLNIEIEGEVVDDEVTTDVEEDAAASIQIYTSDDNEICVITDGTDLQTIYVSSMAGRTQAYEVSGAYARLRLPVAQGVYLVQVIAENATRSEKVVLK